MSSITHPFKILHNHIYFYTQLKHFENTCYLIWNIFFGSISQILKVQNQLWHGGYLVTFSFWHSHDVLLHLFCSDFENSKLMTSWRQFCMFSPGHSYSRNFATLQQGRFRPDLEVPKTVSLVVEPYHHVGEPYYADIFYMLQCLKAFAFYWVPNYTILFSYKNSSLQNVLRDLLFF